jgi:hypothetical protein
VPRFGFGGELAESEKERGMGTGLLQSVRSHGFVPVLVFVLW